MKKVRIGDLSSDLPRWPIPRLDLDRLIAALEISFVRLAECLVAPGWRLSCGGNAASALHYCVSGDGWLSTNRFAPIQLRPHTLIILPKDIPFHLESNDFGSSAITRSVKASIASGSGIICRYVAGEEKPSLLMICGYFEATYAPSIGLFGALQTPIIEHFDENDKLDKNLSDAIQELVAEEIGAGTMTASLLKLVLIRLLRRSMVSQAVWIERFSLLRDPQISKAFSEMVAAPGRDHSVHSLAKYVGMSRSAFMSRFTNGFGHSPMAILRELRLRHALRLLATPLLSMDQVAREIGYKNRSSFSRAFKEMYHVDPTEYRVRGLKQAACKKD